jgi:hypothetical protein
MKFKIAIATIAGCAALAACGGNNAEENVANYDANMDMDMNAGMTDLNAGMSDNLAVSANNVTVVENADNATNMDMNADTTNTTNSL